jgi:hypothetical protein
MRYQIYLHRRFKLRQFIVGPLLHRLIESLVRSQHCIKLIEINNSISIEIDSLHYLINLLGSEAQLQLSNGISKFFSGDRA